MGNHRRLVGVVQSCILLSSPLAGAAPPAEATAPTERQINKFSEVVDDSSDHVRLRLRADPALALLAIRAAEGRDSRKHAGMALVVAGAVVFGASDIASTVVILTTPGYPRIQSSDLGRVLLGFGIAVAGLATGLGLGIPGVFQLAKPSDDENHAIQYYKGNTENAPPPAAPTPAAPGVQMSLPVLSFAF